MASKFNVNNLGAGLFNNQSMALANNTFEITYIPYDKLRVAEENTYSITGIEELAEAIQDIGLQQNLSVTSADEDGYYRILAGQRRYLAIGKLIQQGNLTYQNVPCMIQANRGELNGVSDEIKQLYIIATTNRYRDMSEADKLLQVEQLSKVYDAIQSNGGAERLGMKRRDFIAQSTNMSPRSAQDYITTNKNLLPELKQEVVSEQLPIAVAAKIAALPGEQQEEIYKDYAQAKENGDTVNLTPEKVKEFKEGKLNSKQTKKTKRVLEYDSYIINEKDLAFLTQQPEAVSSVVKKAAAGLNVDRKTKEKLLDIEAQYKKLQNTFVKTLSKVIKQYENN